MQPMSKRNTPTDKLAALADCITRIANERDKTAFAELFDHYAPQIRAYSLARDPGSDLVADDLVQEVMTRVWLQGFEIQCPPRQPEYLDIYPGA